LNSPAQTFEVALTTPGSVARSGEAQLAFTRSGETLAARIEASAPWELQEETIDEEGLVFIRVAVRLREPATSGFIRVRFSDSQPTPR
jgi:hypothetical protein